MLYRISANVVSVTHLLFILFVVFGGFLLLLGKKWAILHLPAVIWAAAIEFRGWVCPLTPLENWLRHKGGLDVYSEGFIEHYIFPLLYPSGLTKNIQIVLGTLVIVINLSVYVWVYLKTRH